MKKGVPQSQQDFLRQAMTTLDMTREQFADRIGAKKRALDNWLLASDSSEFRTMPEMVWKFVREILEHRSKSA
ncbi:transcriptional regulator [Burkholderia sp. 3C]